MDFSELDRLVDQGVGNPNLTPEQNKRLLRSIQENADLAPRQLLQWVENTAYYVQRLATVGRNASDAEICAFWLRLYGLFNEVREDFATKVKTNETVFAGAPLPPNLQGEHARLKRPLSALTKAQALLSEDELLYLKYRRDTEAHVWQDAYRLGLRGKKGLRETTRVFGRDWPIDELNRRINEVVRKYGVNENAIANDFARRLHAVMQEVLAECRQYCE